MKIRNLFLALLVSLVTSFAFAAEQAATLSEDLSTQVRTAAQTGDTRALAQLVADNPSLAVQIASVATAANPSAAANIATTIAAIAPTSAAQVAAAVAAIAPAQASLVAASVATVVPTAAAQIAGSVAAAAPQQAGAVAAAVSAAAPTLSGDVIAQVATATNSSTDTVTAQASQNSSLGQAAAQTGAAIASNVIAVVSMISANPIIPQVGGGQSHEGSPNVPVVLPDASGAGSNV